VKNELVSVYISLTLSSLIDAYDYIVGD